MEAEPVIPSAVVLSDNVIREAGTNKLTIIGTFSVWNAATIPFTAPPFFITCFVTNLRQESGEMIITARIENPEKHVVWSSQAKIGYKTKGTPSEGLIELPIPVRSVTFPFAGRYSVKVLTDGDEIGSRDFFVRPVTAQSG